MTGHYAKWKFWHSFGRFRQFRLHGSGIRPASKRTVSKRFDKRFGTEKSSEKKHLLQNGTILRFTSRSFLQVTESNFAVQNAAKTVLLNCSQIPPDWINAGQDKCQNSQSIQKLSQTKLILLLIKLKIRQSVISICGHAVNDHHHHHHNCRLLRHKQQTTIHKNTVFLFNYW